MEKEVVYCVTRESTANSKIKLVAIFLSSADATKYAREKEDYERELFPSALYVVREAQV